MLALNAKQNNTSGTATKEFVVKSSSPLHRFLEHSLLEYKLNLDKNFGYILKAHSVWSSSYESVRYTVIRIVSLQKSSISAGRKITGNLHHTKVKSLAKYLKQVGAPYIEQLGASIELLQNAIVTVQNAHDTIVKMIAIPGLDEIVFYRKWNVRRFLNFIGEMLGALKWDVNIRRVIKARITTTMYLEELQYYKTFWNTLHTKEQILKYKKLFNEFEHEIGGLVM